MGFPLKNKQKITIIKWLSGDQQSKIKAGKSAEFVKSLVTQEAYRDSISVIVKWVGRISDVAKYLNAGLTACVNLSSSDPNALQGVTAYLFEGLARPGELYILQQVNKQLILGFVVRASMPVVIQIAAPVAIATLVTKPLWNAIEKNVRHFIRSLQTNENTDVVIVPLANAHTT